jgi:GTP:adenosylcobinamide-phosphate guanylyltransferase
MECVVVAGGHPAPDDPLYAYSHGKPKAMIDMEGQTMLEYVVHALLVATQVQEVIVVGIEPDLTTELTFPQPVSFLPDQGTLFQNARSGMDWYLAHRPEDRLIMFATADIPLIQGAHVDDFIIRCRPLDQFAYYPLVRQDQMEQQFPNSGRTFVQLKGSTFTNGNITLIDTRLLKTGSVWGEEITNARKHPWKLVRLLGFTFLLKYLLRQLTVADVEQKVSQITGTPVKSLFVNYAELAMDADNPHQVELMRRQLARQQA